MAARIWVLNGPNLNMLGVREPHIYGSTTLAAVEENCRAVAAALGARIECRQTNHEGVLVDWIHEAREAADALVINPAGCSFGSIPLFDALKIFEGPIVELHISNIHARDELHRHSIMSAAATTVICGAGVYGYTLAVQAAVHMTAGLPDALPDAIRTGPV